MLCRACHIHVTMEERLAASPAKQRPVGVRSSRRFPQTDFRTIPIRAGCSQALRIDSVASSPWEPITLYPIGLIVEEGGVPAAGSREREAFDQLDEWERKIFADMHEGGHDFPSTDLPVGLLPPDRRWLVIEALGWDNDATRKVLLNHEKVRQEYLREVARRAEPRFQFKLSRGGVVVAVAVLIALALFVFAVVQSFES